MREEYPPKGETYTSSGNSKQTKDGVGYNNDGESTSANMGEVKINEVGIDEEMRDTLKREIRILIRECVIAFGDSLSPLGPLPMKEKFYNDAMIRNTKEIIQAVRKHDLAEIEKRKKLSSPGDDVVKVLGGKE